MITDQDITKLKKVFATKDEVGDLRIEVGEIKDKLDDMDVKLDRFLGKIDNLEHDNTAGAVMLYRHDRHIKTLADHADITLPE